MDGGFLDPDAVSFWGRAGEGPMSPGPGEVL